MTYLLRGALIEYGTGLDRADPERGDLPVQPGVAVARAADSAAADRRDAARDHAGRREDLREDHLQGPFQRRRTCWTTTRCWRALFGIGPQLAALEKMVLPSSKIAGLIGAAIDAIAGALGRPAAATAGAADPAREVPAHPVHLGPDPGAAGDHRFDDDHRAGIRLPAQPGPRRGGHQPVRDRRSISAPTTCSPRARSSTRRSPRRRRRSPTSPTRSSRSSSDPVLTRKGCRHVPVQLALRQGRHGDDHARHRRGGRGPQAAQADAGGRRAAPGPVGRPARRDRAAAATRDATQFWHIADANTALDSRTLVAEPGDTRRSCRGP